MLEQQRFLDSYTRIFGPQINISARGDIFFSQFYQRFLASSNDVVEAFKGTDMAKQQSMLKKSILYSIHFMTDSASFDMMNKIAVSHSRKHYNIKPELYDLWLDCLIFTVREMDPEYSDEVELAWRLAFSQCITYMKFMYEK